MKKALWYCGRVTKQLIVAGSIMAAASAWAGINDGLVAFYPFDGNAKDATGNGNNGTVYGATLGTNRFNQGDASYNFDGSGDYMEVPHSSLFNINTNDFSLSLWLKYEQQPAPLYYSAICIKSSNGEYPYEGFTLFVDSPDNSCTFRIDGREPLLCQTNDLHNNTWRHFVCIKQANQLKIYIDGSFDNSRTIYHTNVDNLAPIIFGVNHIDHNNQNYKGAMDDIRLYNRALSLAEIQSLYMDNTMALAITTSIAWVTYDASAIPLAGTETGAVGHLCVSNAANGEIRSFDAAPSWQSPQIPLAVGPNTISAYATNAYGNTTNASVTITRGGIGTGAPFVDITNTTPPTLSYDVTSFTIGITNNMQVVGTRRWANALTSANGALVNNQASIPLGVGANVITVTGTNALNVSASDTITITRGGIGTGAPFVDITNVLAGSVNNAVSTFTVAGTNNPQVVGTMWWVNAADGSRGTFDASPGWQAAVPLVVGLNTITVYGTNLWAVLTNDPINVMRLPGAPASVRATDGTFTNIVRVTFAASVGATKYMVCRAPAGNPTNFTALSGEITATSYDDATIAAGQQYYYAVQAGSPYGWSALSASDSGFALFAINAGEWKYKAGAKVNKKGKLTGKDILKGAVVNPPLMPYFAQGWRIGLAGLVQGALTNWSGPYSLTPNKSQKLWQVKDPAKGTPKVCFIKYSVNDKKGDKLDYQLWTNMPADKVLYILPTNLLFGTATLLNEQGSSEPPVQFRLQPAGKADKQGWQPLDATVIGVQ